MALLAGLLTFSSFLSVSVVLARRAYRREYNLIYGSPAPSTYGGKNGHAVAHKHAMSEALWIMAFWPFYGMWNAVAFVVFLIKAGFLGMITGGARLRWVERDEEIRQVEQDVDQLASFQDPLKDIDRWIDEARAADPEVQVRMLEQPDPDPWEWAEDPVLYINGMPQGPVPEITRTEKPELFAPHMACGNIREYEVGTVAHPGVKLFIDDRGHCWEA